MFTGAKWDQSLKGMLGPTWFLRTGPPFMIDSLIISATTNIFSIGFIKASSS